MVPSILRQFLKTVFLLVIFAHCSKLEKRKKWKTLIIFFEAIICQTDGLSSNSRVTEKIEELVNLVSFERDQLKFGKLKRRLACLHTALGSALKSSPFFFPFFFLYSCPPMYPYYLAWSTENQPTRFSLHIQLQLLCWKTILLLHTDPNAKKNPSQKAWDKKWHGYFSLLWSNFYLDDFILTLLPYFFDIPKFRITKKFIQKLFQWNWYKIWLIALSTS